MNLSEQLNQIVQARKEAETREAAKEKTPEYWDSVRAEAQAVFCEITSACRARAQQGLTMLNFSPILDKNVAIHLQQLLQAEGLIINLYPPDNLMPCWWLNIQW